MFYHAVLPAAPPSPGKQTVPLFTVRIYCVTRKKNYDCIVGAGARMSRVRRVRGVPKERLLV